MTSQFSVMTSSIFFDVALFFVSNLVTGPSLISLSLVLELWKLTFVSLNRNLETKNIPVWVFPNIWRLGQVRDTKYGTYVSTKMLLNAEKCQGYSFYCFWVIKGKPTGQGGGGGGITPAPHHT